MGGFDRHLSQIQLLSGGGGKCKARLEIIKDYQNVGGTLHGGFTATLIDSVSTLALMTSEKGAPGTSVDLKVSYLSSVKIKDTILIEADTLKVGRNLAFLAVQIKNEKSGKLVATGEHIKFVG
ncbi:UNVERIFIED_CONTAM: hypothetical protein GTU68_050680 [Idotea baltica]|nr:hypothetical protein [Idotea baltica]